MNDPVRILAVIAAVAVLVLPYLPAIGKRIAKAVAVAAVCTSGTRKRHRR